MPVLIILNNDATGILVNNVRLTSFGDDAHLPHFNYISTMSSDLATIGKTTVGLMEFTSSGGGFIHP